MMERVHEGWEWCVKGRTSGAMGDVGRVVDLFVILTVAVETETHSGSGQPFQNEQ